jgi:hypothetical protein
MILTFARTNARTPKPEFATVKIPNFEFPKCDGS